MSHPAPQTTYLKDYRPPAYLIENVALDIDIHSDATVVRAVLEMSRNPTGDQSAPLKLNGDGLTLESVAIDGRVLTPDEYGLDPEHLTIAAVPARFTITTVVRIHPEQNTQLMGLYADRKSVV